MVPEWVQKGSKMGHFDPSEGSDLRQIGIKWVPDSVFRPLKRVESTANRDQTGLRSGGSEGQGSEIKGELTNWTPKWVPQIANLTSGDPIQGRAHSEGALFRPLKRVESTANRDQTGPGSGRNQ